MEPRIKRPRAREEATKGLLSLSRSISPPPLAKRHRPTATDSIASPFQLTWIRDLGEEDNRDAVTLTHLLGDALICECWNFNYLHDLHFLMGAFHPDVRSQIRMHVVHGFWKREDTNRLQLVEDASCFPNVQLHVAPMPVMFGTHHSKMLVLFRRNDTAQVIIHTANMIANDWTNMTNAVWKSPPLPKLPSVKEEPIKPQDMKRGSGGRFKYDLLNYLKAYDEMRSVCTSLSKKLKDYDFSQIRGSLVASIPGTHDIHQQSDATQWGWSGLGQTLRQVPCGKDAQVVVQVSSIATLGGKDAWLKGTLFEALSKQQGAQLDLPEFKVVFPTAHEIRNSLDGYASGGSIHTKIQSKQQELQLRYLRPMLHHWAADWEAGQSKEMCDAGRDRAAPHVKTYIRYSGRDKTIDWALLTSANLSKQAWGEAARAAGRSEFRIASWEVGVLVWPSLIKEGAVMKASFKSDRAEEGGEEGRAGDGISVVGLRIPYSLPLERYGEEERPWVATMAHEEADHLGQRWMG